MATRNRLSMAGAGGSALLDSLDAFKRKHVSQNKEIIHRNSELMKANADLNKRVRELQTELLTLKSENLRLAAQNTDLIHGRDVMQKEQETIGNAMQARAVRKALEMIVQQAQQAQSLLAESQKQQDLKTSHRPFQPSRSGSTTPTERLPIRDPTPLSAPPESLLTNRILLSTEPDLSLIAEQSVELDERPTTPVLDLSDESPIMPSPPSSPTTPVEIEPARARAQARRRSSALPLPQLALLDDATPATFTMRQSRTASDARPKKSEDASTSESSGRPKRSEDMPSRKEEEPAKKAEKRPLSVEDEPSSSTSRKFKPSRSEEQTKPTNERAKSQRAEKASMEKEAEKIERERAARRRKKEDLPAPEPIRERSTTPASEPEEQEEPERPRSTRTKPISKEPPHDSQYTDVAESDERQVLAEQTNRVGVEGLDGVKKVARRKVADLGMLEEEKGGQENDTGRRARKSVNYALPNLRDKMRQPEGYVPTIKKPAARLSHSIASEATTVMERVERRRSGSGRPLTPSKE